MNTLHHQLRLPGPLPPGFHWKITKSSSPAACCEHQQSAGRTARKCMIALLMQAGWKHASSSDRTYRCFWSRWNPWPGSQLPN